VIFAYHQFSNVAAISWREQVNFLWDDDDVRFVLDQHAELDFIVLGHWNNSKREDMSLNSSENIILIASQLVFALFP
jgi:hypothetical protein